MARHLTFTVKMFASVFFVVSVSMIAVAFYFALLRQMVWHFDYFLNDIIPMTQSLHLVDKGFLEKGMALADFSEGEIQEGEVLWMRAEEELQQGLLGAQRELHQPTLAYFISAPQLQQLGELNESLNVEKELIVQSLIRGEENHIATTSAHFIIEDGSDSVNDLLSGLRIATRISQEDVFNIIKSSLPWIILATIVFLFIVILTAYGSTISLARPLDSIARKVSSISRGNFRERITLAPGDEFAELANAINSMAGQLGNLYGTLESRVAERTAELAASEAKYKSLVDDAQVGVFATDVAGHLLYANKKLYKLFGYGSMESMQDIAVPDRYRFSEDREELLVALKRKGSISDFEVDMLTKKGEVISVVLNASMQGDQIHGMIIDLTEKKRNEARIYELNELRNKFIHVVSHQLRTPLSAMRWNLETLLSGEAGKLKEGQKELLHITHAASMEVISRTSDMLIAMDIEEGRSVMRKQEVSLDSLWNSVAIELKKICELKEITFTHLTPPGQLLPIVNIDAEKIRAVLEKLTENAATYTKNGGKITTAFERLDGHIRFTVTDNGIGIPKAEHKYIFTRFYRATNASSQKPDASGLGLALAKYFVEQHGGKIGFSSEEGKGSAFWFELPIESHGLRVPKSEDSEKKEKNTKDDKGSTGEFAKMREPEMKENAIKSDDRT